MALLLFSRRCEHCNNIIEYVRKNEPLHSVVSFHDVNQKGIPDQLKGKISSVPTMITKDGGLLVGKEILSWFESILPSEFQGMGGDSMSGLDLDNPEEGDGGMFNLDNYGGAIAAQMTPELEARINVKVSDASYSERQ
tara:strand:- start:3537 stop:3950 length:414 start_codon:yes stop_codon:yes gene_type:complete